MSTSEIHQQNRISPTGTGTSATTATAVSTGGGIAEALCSVVVIGLAIAGLASQWPVTLAGIAMIVFGAALLLADAGVVTYFSRFSRRAGTTNFHLSGGLGVEAIAGVAGIVLGILTLIGVTPYILSAASIVAFGVSVILGGVARARLAMRGADWLGSGQDVAALREAHTAAVAARALIGLAATVLGIVGITMAAALNPSSILLSLVGLLCLGAGGLLSGAAFGGQAYVTSRQ